jgi:hypothetical protein
MYHLFRIILSGGRLHKPVLTVRTDDPDRIPGYAQPDIDFRTHGNTLNVVPDCANRIALNDASIVANMVKFQASADNHKRCGKFSHYTPNPRSIIFPVGKKDCSNSMKSYV